MKINAAPQPSAKSNDLTNPFTLYQRLASHDSKAIDFLWEKVKASLAYKNYLTRASNMDIEEITSDVIMLTLRKIADNSYTFQGSNPVSFALTIADNLLRNFSRKRQLKFIEIEACNLPFIQPEVEAYLIQKDQEVQIERMLSKLSNASQRVIRLKYFDGLKDEEIVENGLAPYSTTDSLKSARCRSLKRLATLQALKY